ncbi:unnamed protein product, partial [Meganyctiphanes norvegica]
MSPAFAITSSLSPLFPPHSQENESCFCYHIFSIASGHDILLRAMTFYYGKLSLINNRLELVPAMETKIEALVATAMQLRWKLKAVYETAGPPGDPGAPGVEGDQGDTGPTGEPGHCPDQRCLVGPPGPSGPQGSKGPDGRQGECCYGRRGRRGDGGDRGQSTKGPQGELGEKGHPGAPGRILIDMNVGLTSNIRDN